MLIYYLYEKIILVSGKQTSQRYRRIEHSTPSHPGLLPKRQPLLQLCLFPENGYTHTRKYTCHPFKTPPTARCTIILCSLNRKVLKKIMTPCRNDGPTQSISRSSQPLSALEFVSPVPKDWPFPPALLLHEV